MIEFRNIEHEKKFYGILQIMKSNDCYHQAVAYLISLDTVCRQHIADMFDFSEDIIKPESLNQPWQTGTSKKTTRLMFNLWNSFSDEQTTPENIFACSYAPYYWQAIKLRYPEYADE